MLSRFVASFLIFALLVPTPALAYVQKKKSSKKTAGKTSAQRAAERNRARAAVAEKAREQRAQAAFAESADLKPMATQLHETHSNAAFSAVEAYAKRHGTSEAAALAWLTLGLAYAQDQKFEKAISAYKNAKVSAWELSDYVDFYLANAYRSLGRTQDVVVVLDGFDKRYPESIFVRDAALTLATVLSSIGADDRAVLTLEPLREPTRSDVEAALGRAYAAIGKKEIAIEALRNVYYNMPMSGQAEDSGALLKRLVGSGPYATLEMRKQRADLLVRGRRASQAISEYKQMIAENSPKQTPGIEVALANALYKVNRQAEAKQVLLNIDGAKDEVAAQRLYLLAELARSSGDDSAHAQTLQELRVAHSTSGWFQEALLSAGNKFLLRRDFEQAAAHYQELAEKFTGAKYGASSHWKSAWLRYRMGNRDAAKKQFERHIVLFPSSNETANALYWRGRMAEDDGEPAVARAYYQKLSDRFRNYYYAVIARERLRMIGVLETASVTLLDNIQPVAPTPRYLGSADGISHPRLNKSRLLTNGGLYDLATRELQQAITDGEQRWALGELVALQRESGKPHRALQTLKKYLPSYFAVDLGSLPRPFLEVLFPKAYWDAVRNHSNENELDPYLVASLIRQESEFNPAAVSHANAYGLMQLLPSVGRQVAREVKLRPFSTSRLLEPTANIKLGTRYFRQMINENGGQVEYALAAYNAGGHRVNQWLDGASYRDIHEFVESIPFTETREYVQAIMRNVSVYKRLYGNANN